MQTPMPPAEARRARDRLAAVLDTVIDGVISIDESQTMLSAREEHLVGLPKPVHFAGLIAMAKVICEYRFGIAPLPKQEARW